MSSSCSASGAGEGLEVGEHAVDQLLAAGRVGHGLLQAREAEHLALGVVRLDDAVGVQEHAVARLRASASFSS